MMTHVDVDRGHVGAKRVSYQKRTFRDIALKILVDNPDEPVENLAEDFIQLLIKDHDALRSLAIYGLTNVRLSLTPIRGGLPRTPAVVTEKEVIDKAATEITNKITANLMQFVMPSGKTLAQSTGAECDKVGGWFKIVAKRVGPQGIVGKKLNELELQKLLKESQRKK
jgi:hypothetical protein